MRLRVFKCGLAMLAMGTAGHAAADPVEIEELPSAPAMSCTIGEATPVADPAEFVKALYGEEVAVALLLADIPMTERLRQSFCAEAGRLEAYDAPIGRIDFDWVVDGQDFLLSELEFSETDTLGAVREDPARKVVFANFKNFDEPVRIGYFWEKDEQGWRLDEVVSYDDERGWVLSLLLDYG